MTDTSERSEGTTHFFSSPSTRPQLDTASCPLLFRIGDKFRVFGLRPGSFLEYYPPPPNNSDEKPKPPRAQVELGPRTGEEYFLPQDKFRAPPSGAITYKVQPGGRLLFLEENLV